MHSCSLFSLHSVVGTGSVSGMTALYCGFAGFLELDEARRLPPFRFVLFRRFMDPTIDCRNSSSISRRSSRVASFPVRLRKFRRNVL
jgi:hypothetical protein